MSTLPSHNRAQGDLSSMPIEIIELVLHNIHNSREDHDLDHQCIQELQHSTYSLPLKEIRSLASVNRSFYQVFSPYLFQALDLEDFTVDKLTFTLEEIIKRHSEHVKRIRWRILDHNSLQEDRKEQLRAGRRRRNPSRTPQWNLRSRSELLLRILESCPHITDLDIDLDPRPFIPTESSAISYSKDIEDSSSSSGNQMPNLLIEPITRLTSITHISLSSAYLGPRYTEAFVVRILANFPQLKYISCTGIDATHPRPLDDRQACQSPLGIHLALLTSLAGLELQRAECVDLSWSQLDWKSSLKLLSLVHCNRVSVPALHKLIKHFDSTLTILTCNNLDNFAYGKLHPIPIREAVENDEFRFELPKLTKLEISTYLPIQFARSFRHSKNLTWLSIGDPYHSREDFEDLIKNQLWPKMKKFELPDYQETFLSRTDFKGLQAVCQQHGVEMFFRGKVFDADAKDVYNSGMFALAAYLDKDQSESDDSMSGDDENYDDELEEYDGNYEYEPEDYDGNYEYEQEYDPY